MKGDPQRFVACGFWWRVGGSLAGWAANSPMFHGVFSMASSGKLARQLAVRSASLPVTKCLDGLRCGLLGLQKRGQDGVSFST